MSFGFITLAVATSYFFSSVAKVVARRTGLLDPPDGRRKAQPVPMPLLGGVAVFLSLLITVLVARFGYSWEWLASDRDPSRDPNHFVDMLLISGGLFCLVGFWDDAKGLRPRTKLLLQIIAALPFVIWGRSVETVHLLDVQFKLGLLGYAFTAFWLIACSNAINLVDGLDGLAGTVGLIACLGIATLSNIQGTFSSLALGLVFAGSLFGFLLHNWPPASIYLGDAGSLTIGFVIGALAIESSMKTATGFALAIPLVLVSVPAFDTFMAILRRKLNGKGIGEADRGHIHHCLQDRGLSRAKSLLVISALCVVMTVVSVVSAYFQNDWLALELCLTLLALLIVGRVFGYNETVLIFRYIQSLSTLLAGTTGVLRTQRAVDRMARANGAEPIHYWKQITEHVEALGGIRLEFVCWNENDDDVICRLRWTSERHPPHDEPAWEFNYSVPGKHGLRATLSSNGNLHNQLKGRRLVDLFRLFDTFCHSWTTAVALIDGKSQPASIIALPTRPGPTIEPAIIPLTPPAKERRAA
jgi:UDP-GlcNAc:undecaprenyl-phosphate/decaprenyl-phosphate GlcNAc-1-phosphate transferase